MKNQLLIFITLIISSLCYSQTDTIYTNNERIPCVVKEITTESVKFSYIGEDLVNSLFKNSVQKIVMKSGRVQTFAESTNYKKINDPNDFEDVTITMIEGDVKGLFRIGSVSSKAKGATAFSAQEGLKARAYRKVKIQAALMGANIVYLANQKTEGVRYGSTGEINLSGLAYNNVTPNIEEFNKLISDKTNFVAVYKYSLTGDGSDALSNLKINKPVIISNVRNESGLILIDVKFDVAAKANQFRVVSFTNEYFNIFFEGKGVLSNFKIQIN
jgi:hypothetical protein